MVQGTTHFYIETRRSDYEKSLHNSGHSDRYKELCPKCHRNYKGADSPMCVYCSRKAVSIRQRAKRYAKLVIEHADVKFYFVEREPDDEELDLEE